MIDRYARPVFILFAVTLVFFIFIFNVAIEKVYNFKTCVMTRMYVADERNACRVVEWIRYNFLIGVDHIYITDDCSPYSLIVDILEGIPNVTVLRTNQCTNYVSNERHIFTTMFKTQCQNNCKWVTSIDIDEYITFKEHKTSSDLKIILENYTGSFLRMPVWIVGSDGHWESPIGFVIESYHRGFLSLQHVKMFAKTSDLLAWHNSFHPHPRNVKIRPTIETHMLYEHERVIKDGIYFPDQPVFVKQYMYTSFSEFNSTHASRYKTSANDKNPWAADSMNKWHDSNHTTLNYANDFTTKISKTLRQSFPSHPMLHPYTNLCNAYWGYVVKEATNKTYLN